MAQGVILWKDNILLQMLSEILTQNEDRHYVIHACEMVTTVFQPHCSFTFIFLRTTVTVCQSNRNACLLLPRRYVNMSSVETKM